MTLMEILLVIAIIALISASALYGASTLPRTRLRAEAETVAARCRAAYVHAVVTGHTTRVRFTIGDNGLTVEETNDAHTLDPKDPFKAGGADDVEAMAREEAQQISSGKPRAKRAAFTPVSERTLKPVVLQGGVRFLRVFTMHDEGPKEKGMGAVYFFPGGESERAMIQLVNPNGDVFTVVVHAITGRTEVIARAVEPPEDDDDDRAADVDVDNRDKPEMEDSEQP